MADETTHKVTDDGVVLVPLKLAHPMAKVYAERCRVEHPRDFPVGATIFVSREYGNALIDAGFVQVDPVDAKARQAALLLNRRNQPLTGDEIEQKTGDADAAVPAATEKPQSAADTKSAAKAR